MPLNQRLPLFYSPNVACCEIVQSVSVPPRNCTTDKTFAESEWSFPQSVGHSVTQQWRLASCRIFINIVPAVALQALSNFVLTELIYIMKNG